MAEAVAENERDFVIRDSAERLQEQMTGRQNAAAETRGPLQIHLYTADAVGLHPQCRLSDGLFSKSEWSLYGGRVRCDGRW